MRTINFVDIPMMEDGLMNDSISSINIVHPGVEEVRFRRVRERWLKQRCVTDEEIETPFPWIYGDVKSTDIVDVNGVIEVESYDVIAYLCQLNAKLMRGYRPKIGDAIISWV